MDTIIETKKYFFTEDGFIVFNPTRKLKIFKDSSNEKIAIFPPSTDPNTIIRVVWTNIVYESDSLRLIEEFALHYFKEHSDKINWFISNLGGNVKQKTFPKIDYLKMLLRYNLVDYFIEENKKICNDF